MNILDTVGINLPCRSCGNIYQVPLRDVMLSHIVLHEGCPVVEETECPPVFQSRLFEHKDIEELQRAWNRLDQRARTDGGELVLMAAGQSDETWPPVPGSLGGRAQAAVPITPVSGPARKPTEKQSEKPQKERISKQTHSKSRTRKRRRVA